MRLAWLRIAPCCELNANRINEMAMLRVGVYPSEGRGSQPAEGAAGVVVVEPTADFGGQKLVAADLVAFAAVAELTAVSGLGVTKEAEILAYFDCRFEERLPSEPVGEVGQVLWPLGPDGFLLFVEAGALRRSVQTPAALRMRVPEVSDCRLGAVGPQFEIGVGANRC